MKHFIIALALFGIALVGPDIMKWYGRKESPPKPFDNTPVAIYSNSIENIRGYDGDDIVKIDWAIPIGAVGDEAMMGAHYWVGEGAPAGEFVVAFASWYHNWDEADVEIAVGGGKLDFEDNDTGYSLWGMETQREEWDPSGPVVNHYEAGRVEIKLTPENFAKIARARKPVQCTIDSQEIELSYEMRAPLRALWKEFEKEKKTISANEKNL